MIIEVHCDDGSDTNCAGMVETTLPLKGLSRDDIEFITRVEDGRKIVAIVRVTPSKPLDEWIAENKDQLAALKITAADVKQHGFVDIYYVDLEPVICKACKSDN